MSFDELDDDRGRALIGIARRAIREAFGEPAAASAAEAWLDAHCATFVTLRNGDSLRGCVGSIEARRPLRDDVAANARAAALTDPRFPPLTADEFPRTRVEVSVLSAPVQIEFVDRDDLIAQLTPFVDGIVLGQGPRRATFLPQVWHMLPRPAEFLDELIRKAQLPVSVDLGRCRVERYHVRKWGEE